MVSDIAERTVAVGGVPTRVLTTDGDGPPVLLLHGLSDSADTWRPLLAELASHGRAAVAVDLPGFGRAVLPAYTSVFGLLDAFVDEAIASVDQGDGVTVAGNSLGGLLALRAARSLETRVDRVVAIAPGGYGQHPAFKVLERGGRLCARLCRLRAVEPVAAWAAGAIGAHAGGGMPREARARFVSHLRNGGLSRTLVIGQDVLRELKLMVPIDPSELQAPVVFVWGSADTVCPLSDLRRLVDHEVVVFDGARHAPQHPRAAELAQIVVTRSGERVAT